MASTVTIDLRHLARGLEISLQQVQAVVELLDEGNTVPFITRYRKDQTGGSDEEQIREIQSRLTRMRLLADRKQTILRSIDAQGKLTEKLAQQIQAATTTKRLEDLYLPYKPKKQTLATLARSRGLEELAQEILAAAPACADLDARARDFANPDRQVPTGADALLGAGHILAEQFSERADLRQRLREILQRSGKFVCNPVPALEQKERAAEAEKRAASGPQTAAETAPPSTPDEETASGTIAEAVPSTPSAPDPNTELAAPDNTEAATEEAATVAEAGDAIENSPGDVPATPAMDSAEATLDPPDSARDSAVEGQIPAEVPAPAPAEQPAAQGEPAAPPPAAPSDGSPPATEGAMSEPAAPAPPAEPVALPTAPAVASAKDRAREARAREKLKKLAEKELKKKRAEERRIKAFRDYFHFQEEIKKIPPHRMLAINRGERARVLRVKIECDLQAMYDALEEMLVPAGHPHADYLRGCARGALDRLILPSLEREVRRELTERAELHAVEVFARNLRNLLLQPPVRDRRVLALDPGYKSGCKLVALDQFGNMLEHAVIFLVGKADRRAQAKEKVVDLVRRHQLSVIAIGNGTACRECENFVGELLAGELKEQGVCYVIVNEAGASVYSTSQIGREELPACDATLRGAISIGRRLQDPLSELVKIDPANIGVGLYQHDVKAKHLRVSLDDVVQSCVNYVGVDLNTASPALLAYVSGLNQLTARRVYEHRQAHGPFRNREQLREVPGFGEATFVQAAGFLKIAGGDSPLDATWIHPESYAVAGRVLERLGCTPADLTEKDKTAALAQRVATLPREELAKELAVGVLTLRDILSQLARPGRDPREDLPPPVFKHGVLKLEDLTPGMDLSGTVLNVVDFGAFVDIGMHDTGLVHVSHLADKFVRDPHEVVAVGDIVRVWVLEVDKQRRRVSLTMVPPGSARPRRGRRDEKPAEGQAAVQGEPAAEGAGRTGARPPRPQGQRPQGQRPTEGRRAPPAGQRGGEGRPPQGRGRAEGRPPQGERRGEGRGPRPGRPRPYSSGPKTYEQSRPKPVIPITDEMKTGKEPMRTFGDLLQFYEHKREPPAAPPQRPPAVPPSAEAPSPAASAEPPTPPAAPVTETPADIAPPAEMAPTGTPPTDAAPTDTAPATTAAPIPDEPSGGQESPAP